MNNFLRILFIFFFFALRVAAQNSINDKPGTFLLQGRLMNLNKESPLPYALVRLYKSGDSSLVNGTTSDTSGRFKLLSENPGEYYLKITIMGYEPAFISSIKLLQNEHPVQLGDIALKKNAFALKEVLIVGKQTFQVDIDKIIYKVDTNALSANGTAGDVLQNIPSVFVGQDGDVTLRGGKVKIYIDGKPSSFLGINKDQIMNFIPANLIDRIEVINDPSAKYDANGSNGIINIILKKQKNAGLNSNIIIGAGSGDKYNGSANLSYNLNKVHLFASYVGRNVNMYSAEIRNRESDLVGGAKYLEQNRNIFSKSFSNFIRFRGEYLINSNNTLSFSYLNSGITGADNTLINYRHFDYLKLPRSVYDREIKEINSDKAANYTFNYSKKFINPQQAFTADFFYSDASGAVDGKISQNYFNPDRTPSRKIPLAINTHSVSSDNNMISQMDYVQPLKNNSKIEIGIKDIVLTSRLNYKLENYYMPFNAYLPDTNISNQFDFKQELRSAYVTYRKKFKFISFKAGLRLEQTLTSLTLFNQRTTTKAGYSNFFPSASIFKELNKNNKLTFRYSKRIDRPRFSEINPLQKFNDPLFLNIGNPLLLPEYTHAYDLSHVKSWGKNALNTSIYYRDANGSIQKFTSLGSDGITTNSFRNIARNQNLGIELSLYIHLTKWYRINCSLNSFRSIMDGTNLGANFKSDTYSWVAKMNNTIQLWKKSTLQLTGNYQAPTYTPFIKDFGQYFMDVSFRQDLFESRMSLSIRCSDLFHTQRKITDQFGPNYDIYSMFNRESRILSFSISYRPFNSGKTKKAKTENEEEIEEEN